MQGFVTCAERVSRDFFDMCRRTQQGFFLHLQRGYSKDLLCRRTQQGSININTAGIFFTCALRNSKDLLSLARGHSKVYLYVEEGTAGVYLHPQEHTARIFVHLKEDTVAIYLPFQKDTKEIYLHVQRTQQGFAPRTVL